MKKEPKWGEAGSSDEEDEEEMPQAAATSAKKLFVADKKKRGNRCTLCQEDSSKGCAWCMCAFSEG